MCEQIPASSLITKHHACNTVHEKNVSIIITQHKQQNERIQCIANRFCYLPNCDSNSIRYKYLRECVDGLISICHPSHILCMRRTCIVFDMILVCHVAPPMVLWVVDQSPCVCSSDISRVGHSIYVRCGNPTQLSYVECNANTSRKHHIYS